MRLAMAVTRLRSRIRIESGLRSTGIPISQVAVLSRIIEEGPTTAAALAAAEHVTQQAIAQSLATLRSVDWSRSPATRVTGARAWSPRPNGSRSIGEDQGLAGGVAEPGDRGGRHTRRARGARDDDRDLAAHRRRRSTARHGDAMSASDAPDNAHRGGPEGRNRSTTTSETAMTESPTSIDPERTALLVMDYQPVVLGSLERRGETALARR